MPVLAPVASDFTNIGPLNGWGWAKASLELLATSAHEKSSA
jgi:hypothetical protein